MGCQAMGYKRTLCSGLLCLAARLGGQSYESYVWRKLELQVLSRPGCIHTSW